MTNKIYSFLGLATKAGKLISGEDACERAIRYEKVGLVIVAEDASNNTKKKFEDMCRYRNIKIRFFGRKEFLGKYIGKDIRSVVAVCEKQFAQRLIEMIDGTNVESRGEQNG